MAVVKKRRLEEEEGGEGRRQSSRGPIIARQLIITPEPILESHVYDKLLKMVLHCLVIPFSDLLNAINALLNLVCLWGSSDTPTCCFTRVYRKARDQTYTPTPATPPPDKRLTIPWISVTAIFTLPLAIPSIFASCKSSSTYAFPQALITGLLLRWQMAVPFARAYSALLPLTSIKKTAVVMEIMFTITPTALTETFQSRELDKMATA